VISWLLACTPEPTELPASPSPTTPSPVPVPTSPTPTDPCACDDGLSCTEDTCVGDACAHEVMGDCAWPAFSVATLALAVPSGELQVALSAAAYDPVRQELWTASSVADIATLWRLAPAGGSWTMAAEWRELPYDIEGLTLVDPEGQPDLVHVLAEDLQAVVALDLSQPGVATELDRWELESYVPTLENLGPEALAFVPDEALAQSGFVGMEGAPYPGGSALGGLVLVGHQNGGRIYAFELAPGGGVAPIGAYLTDRPETSGLEFDPLTGALYIWHGGTNDLEVAHLSSSDVGGPFRKLDTQLLFDHPSTANIEGVAISSAPCVDGARSLFLAAEAAGPASLEQYLDWPLCGP
jgi:hypothetical protein